MARIEYERIDLGFTVARNADGGATIDIETGMGPYRGRAAPTLIAQWLASLLPPLLDAIAFMPAFKTSRQASPPPVALALRDSMRGRARFRVGDRTVLPRIAISIEDAELAQLDWERAIAAFAPLLWPAPLFVRVAAAWPRIGQHALTLPLRFLHTNATGADDVAARVRRIFEHIEPADREEAVQAKACEPSAWQHRWQYENWPTVEVLQIDDFALAKLAPEQRFGTGAPDTWGTLGWLSRVVDVNQTRLVVLSFETDAQARALLRIGTAVAMRGGPAAIVVDKGFAATFCGALYDRIVHDDAIDAAFQDATNATPARCYLIGGCGREDLLRVSTIGVGLRRFREGLARAGAEEVLLARRADRELSLGMPDSVMVRDLRAHLDRFENGWSTLHFEDRESDGLIPLARDLRDIRSTAGIVQPHRAPAATQSPATPRFVNASLFQQQAGAMQIVEQRGARLQLGATYHLKIHVGQKDVRIVTLGDAQLLEEEIKWTPDMTGAWIEVGVTGVDFHVMGDAVQEFWLPRHGDSEPILFAIVPRTAGTAWLRFTLYHRNTVVRSYRLAAAVIAPDHIQRDAANVRAGLADALGVGEERVGDAGYVARLEYSVAPQVATPPERRAPDLSLVANDANGLTVITYKGNDFFGIRVTNDIKEQMTDARRLLHAIENPPVEGVAPDRWPYGFTPGNDGTEQGLKLALTRLAEVGWRLFASLIPGDTAKKARVQALLADGSRVIEVAHIVLEKVIPWSLVYDREYDAQAGPSAAAPAVRHDVCTASLDPRGNHGTLSARTAPGACGSVPGCLLHKDNKPDEAGLTSRTVVCPLHFWGLRHIIGLPAHQVKDGDDGIAIVEATTAGASAEMLRAMNSSLTTAKEHEGELDALTNNEKLPSRWLPTVSEREAVRRALDAANLDVVYFYCHARGGEADPSVKPPRLVFGDALNASLAPEQMGSNAWLHHPLVVLNGCGSVGYSPDALSPFITVLVHDRGAAGLVGTEIPVWESLAGEIARRFLAAFIGGMSAGDALLAARLALLDKYNPLGLAYTLYASPHLRMERSGAAFNAPPGEATRSQQHAESHD